MPYDARGGIRGETGTSFDASVGVTGGEGVQRVSGLCVDDRGFTLVELMVVVLIIGILVSIALPIYADASTKAQARSCQVNQRTITGAIEMYVQGAGGTAATTAGVFAASGSGWYGILVPSWIKSQPSCPSSGTYLLTASGDITGDNGLVVGFKTDHLAP